jgi:hypothetical protein
MNDRADSHSPSSIWRVGKDARKLVALRLQRVRFGGFLMTNPLIRAELEKRFTSYATAQDQQLDGVQYAVLERNCTVNRSPCYAYGYEIGEDIERFFSSKLLVLPRDGAEITGTPYVVLRVSGYSLTSERYDQHSVTTTCTLDSGESFELNYDYYYQKYGGRSEKRNAPLDRLLTYFRENLGYTSITGEQLAQWVRTLRSRFS